MKRSSLIKGLISILLVLILGLSAVGCRRSNKDKTDGGTNDGTSIGGGDSAGDKDSTDSISEVDGADKTIGLFSGDEKEIILADYVVTGGQSGITYEVRTNHSAIILSDVSDGKFIITAGEVNETTNTVVSIIVSCDGVEKLTVELSVKLVEKGGFMPDENVDTDW